MLKQVGGNTCEAEGCYGYARDALCVLHKLEKSEARVAELEAGIRSLLGF